MTSNDPALRQVLDMCQERGNELEQLVVDSLQGAALGDAADSGALLVEARRRRLAVVPKMFALSVLLGIAMMEKEAAKRRSKTKKMRFTDYTAFAGVNSDTFSDLCRVCGRPS